MSLFYPQSAVILDLLWEDWGKANKTLGKNYPLILMPKQLEVNINNYKEADTAKIVLDYANFPFEPRSIRNIRVTCSMADMGRLFDAQGRPDFLSPNDITTLSETARENFMKKLDEATVFVGYADQTEIQFNDDNREVTLECRDQTSLLIDRKFPRKLLDLNKDLHTLIRQILDSSEETEPLKIEWRPDTLQASTPIIASVSPDINDAKKSIKRGESSWDVINDLCTRVALIPFIELDKLVITQPRLLFADSTRNLLSWGENLTGLNFKRRLGRDKGINVEVRSLNLKTKQVIKVKYPEDRLDSHGLPGKAQTIKKISDGEVKEEPAPYHVFFVPNIVNTNVLLDRAEDIWNEMARQELEGSLTTKNMTLCSRKTIGGTTHTDFSTLHIRMGTPLDIQIEATDLAELGTLKGKGVGAMREYLTEKCYAPQVADALAKSFQLMREINTPFYTKNVRLSMNHSQGFSADIDFINFIELDKTLTGTAVPKSQS